MASPADTGFDPTLGGTLEPAHWYDFTDNTTMTFSGSKVIEITSKGSISGSIAKGTGTKYTTNWIGPEYDAVNKCTIFSGSTGGTSQLNSALARRYGTSPGYDLGFANGDQYTTAVFFEPDYFVLTPTNTAGVTQAVSNKGQGSTGLPEEDTWLMIGRNSYAGQIDRMAESANSNLYVAGRHRLSFLSPSNRFTAMSYSGSSNVNGFIGPWQSVYGMNDGTDTSTGWQAMQTSANTGSAGTPLTRDGNNSTHENLTVGNRSRNNVYEGPNFRIRHLVSYKTILTGAQVDDLNASYAAAYPDDNFNPAL